MAEEKPAERAPTKSAKRYANPPGKDGKKAKGNGKADEPVTKTKKEGEGKTPGAEPNPEIGVEDARTQMADRHTGERSELNARHDKERTQMHGRHADDHKKMDARHTEEAHGAGFLGGVTTGEASGPMGAGAGDGSGAGGGGGAPAGAGPGGGAV